MDSTIFHNMFVMDISVLEKILRTILVYLILLVGLRIAGKREMSQLNAFDIVVLLTISNTVQNAIIGNDLTVTGGLIGVATLLFANYLFVRFTYSNQQIETILEGTEDVIIDHGQIQHKVLEREAITVSELEIAAHKQGFSSLSEVDRAVLEPEGGVSFIARKPGPEEARHKELVSRLDQMSAEVASMRRELADLKSK